MRSQARAAGRFDPPRDARVRWAVVVPAGLSATVEPAWSTATEPLESCLEDSPDDRQVHAVRTYSPKPGDIQRQWHVIDASDVVLGRLAVATATLLRGKHKPMFAPHVDAGDFVVIVNAEKVALSGTKRETKLAYRHSGYPGGLRSISYGKLLDTDPRKAIEKAVWGMLPKNRLGRSLIKKLKVYAGPNHPHAAQQPQPYAISQIAQ